MILENIQNAIKDAMRAKDKEQLQTLRMLSAAFKQIKVDKKLSDNDLTDELLMTELMRQCKQRQDAAKQFRENGRDDLALKEDFEISIIKKFLPEQLEASEIKKIIEEVFVKSGLGREQSSLGKLMPELKKQLNGRADMSEVSSYLREFLKT